MGAKYYGGGGGGNKSPSVAERSRQTTQRSSIDAPAGTLSSKSAQTGTSFSSVAERKQVEAFRAGEQVQTGVIRKDVVKAPTQQSFVKGFGGNIKPITPQAPQGSNVVFSKSNLLGVNTFTPVASRDPYIRDASGNPIGLKAPEVVTAPTPQPQRQAPQFTPAPQQEQQKEFNLFSKKGNFKDFISGGLSQRIQTTKEFTELPKEQQKELGIFALQAAGTQAIFLATAGGAGSYLLQRTALPVAQRLAPTTTRTFIQTASRVQQAIDKRLITSIPVRFGALGAQTYVIGKTGEFVTERTASTKEGVKQFKEVFLPLQSFAGDPFKRDAQGNPIGLKPEPKQVSFFKTETTPETLQPKSFGKRALQDLTLFSTFLPSEEKQLKENIRSYAQLQGLSDAETAKLEKEVLGARGGLAFTELLQLGNIERGVEAFGRRNIGKQFVKSGVQVGEIAEKKVTGEIARRTSLSFLAGGAAEGVLGNLADTQLKGGGVDPLSIFISGGVGAATGGFFGIPTASFKPTRPAVSGAFGFVGNVLDFPFEQIGDVSQDVTERLTRRATGQPRLIPSVQRINRKGTETFILGEAKEFLPSRAPKIIAPNVNFGLPSLAFGQPTKTPTPVRSPRFPTLPTGLPNLFKSPFGQQTPTETKQEFGSTYPIQTPTPTQTQTQLPFNIKTPAAVTTFNMGIPIVTPVSPFFAMPPIPPMFPAASSGRGAGRTQRRYLNELAASQQLFTEQLGFNVQHLLNPIKKPTKTKKGKIKRK